MKRMKKFFKSGLAVFLPWLILLLDDNPGGAFVALIMQATVIGWPFASIWAWRIVNPSQSESAGHHKATSSKK